MIDVGGYCIDSTEVTQRHYQDFLSAKSGDTSGQPGSCGWNSSYVPAGTSLTGCSSYTLTATTTPSLPVTCVDWCDAYAYCKWAGKRLCGKIGGGPNPPASRADVGSSQWFRACSNAGTRTYPYSSTYDMYSCRTEASDFVNVGSIFQCKGAGIWSNLFDMSGNALEWEDSCDGSLSDSKCEARGGYFASNAAASTCSAAVAPARNFSLRGLGFRCCGP